MRHLFDKVVAGAALVVFSPLFVALAAAIKIDSAGEVFFRQERVGKNGKIFKIHKFRSMHVHADKINISATGDKRVTRVGKVLRKTKIDELPQLIDVIKGEMAIVGPRPEVPEYVAKWPAELKDKILSVLPGITDPASIAYRNEADELARADEAERYYVEVILPRKAALYAKYVDNRSWLGDMKLILQTIVAVVTK